MPQEDAQEPMIRRVISKELAVVISIVSIALGVVNYFTTPERSNKEQIEYMKGVIDKNQTITDTLTKSQQNDLHTLEGKLEQQRISIDALTQQVTKVTTILEERLPSKK